mmetsp:Transcript_10376/g.18311  ORF Transcript_10376/g.18311 Transcript_10376/m.18311 type:complete len:88 (+) Transcript_10376:1988-2251(+)
MPFAGSTALLSEDQLNIIPIIGIMYLAKFTRHRQARHLRFPRADVIASKAISSEPAGLRYQLRRSTAQHKKKNNCTSSIDTNAQRNK